MTEINDYSAKLTNIHKIAMMLNNYYAVLPRMHQCARLHSFVALTLFTDVIESTLY